MGLRLRASDAANCVCHPSDAGHPGFKHFIIRPRPDGGLTYAKGELDTLYGKISSHWRIENGKFKLDCVVPPNTSATVYLPSAVIETAEEKDGQTLEDFTVKEDCSIYTDPAGNYRFVCR